MTPTTMIDPTTVARRIPGETFSNGFFKVLTDESISTGHKTTE
jgi:hypothetical protein